jgi:hypothetical protein
VPDFYTGYSTSNGKIIDLLPLSPASIRDDGVTYVTRHILLRIVA